jgi:hypothetical protein
MAAPITQRFHHGQARTRELVTRATRKPQSLAPVYIITQQEATMQGLMHRLVFAQHVH